MYNKRSICIIGIDLPLIHDSTRDACVAMQLADFVQKNGNYYVITYTHTYTNI